MNKKLIFSIIAAVVVIGVIVLAVCVIGKHDDSKVTYSEQETPYKFSWKVEERTLSVSVKGAFEQDAWSVSVEGVGLTQSAVTENKKKAFSVKFEVANAGYTTIIFKKGDEEFSLTTMTMPEGTIEIMGDSFDSAANAKTDYDIIRDYYLTDTSDMTEEQIAERQAAFETAKKAETERYEASLSEEQKEERRALEEAEKKELEENILKMTELSGFTVPQGYSVKSVSIEEGSNWYVSAVIASGENEYVLDISAGTADYYSMKGSEGGNCIKYSKGTVEAYIGNAEGYAVAIWADEKNTYTLDPGISYSNADAVKAIIDELTK